MSFGANELEDQEQPLDRVTPRRAPESLRGAVLATVAEELSAARPVRWERRLSATAAGLLVAAVAFNLLINYAGESRLDAFFASQVGVEIATEQGTEQEAGQESGQEAEQAIHGGIARSGASLIDNWAARRIATQMLTTTASVATPAGRDSRMRGVRHSLTEWTLHGGNWVNAQSVEDTPPNRRRPGDSDRGALDGRGPAQLASEHPA